MTDYRKDTFDDVASPIDFRLRDHARSWAETAMEVRPWRREIFQRISGELGALNRDPLTVLDLGSGPGFLGAHLLQDHPSLNYVALDFSAAMHQLGRERLGLLAERTRFVERDFKHTGWSEGLGPIDAVVTSQAVHELRHKRHAPALYHQVRQLLSGGGVFLMCDHFAGEGGLENRSLYMTAAEQREALKAAGFSVELLMRRQTLLLFRAVVP
jgi:SAM-dependent methyltransferase